MREAVELGERAGFVMVPVDVDISSIFYSTVNAIAAGSFVKHMQLLLHGEQIIEDYRNILLKDKLPAFLVELVGWFSNKDPRRFRRLVNATINSTMRQLVQSLAAVEAEKRKYEAIMIAERLDAWLLPTGALPAILHGQAAHLLGSVTYAMFFNVLHLPAGAVPVTRVRADEEAFACGFEDQAAAQGRLAMQRAAGLPVGVQVGCRPFRDELLLSIMRRFEAVLGATRCVFE